MQRIQQVICLALFKFNCQVVGGWIFIFVADFLSNHGGKVALVAFSVAIGLIYSYYQSGEDRTRQERNVRRLAAIEPYEIQELRHCSKIDTDKYNLIVSTIRNEEHGEMVYGDFVAKVSKLSGNAIRGGYILDRLVWRHALAKGILSQSNDEGERHGKDVVRLRELRLPVSFLLVVLSLALQDSAEERVSGLVRIIEESEPGVDSISLPVGDRVPFANTSVAIG